jgi:hypothetical protein
MGSVHNCTVSFGVMCDAVHMLELVVTEKIDGNPVAWRCSDCRQSFSARGKLSAKERLQKVTTEFKSHVEESHKAKAVASGIGYSAIASH